MYTWELKIRINNFKAQSFINIYISYILIFIYHILDVLKIHFNFTIKPQRSPLAVHTRTRRMKILIFSILE